MNIPLTVNSDPLLAKIEEILIKVQDLRQQVTEEADSLLVIQEAAVLRTYLDELERLVFERFSRECLLSAMERDALDVGELLVVLHRLFK